MKKLFAVGVVCGALMAAPALAAQDENIDFGSATCGELLSAADTAGADDMAGMMLWLDGYLSGVSGDTVLNWSNLSTFVDQLGSYCQSHKSAKLLDAARKVGLGQ